MIRAGLKQNKIAEKIGTSRSIISRELKRNIDTGGYRPIQAQNKIDQRKLQIKRKSHFTLSQSKLILTELSRKI